MDPQAVSVVIAAGHGVVGEVARRACAAGPGLVVVGEVRDGAALLEACRTFDPMSSCSTRPSTVVALSSLRSARSVRKAWPSPPWS